MKCPVCHKVVLNIGHVAREHKAWLKKRSQSPTARAKAARTRAAKARGESSAPRATKRTRKGKSARQGPSVDSEGIPEAPVGFVVETVTYRRA